MGELREMATRRELPWGVSIVRDGDRLVLPLRRERFSTAELVWGAGVPLSPPPGPSLLPQTVGMCEQTEATVAEAAGVPPPPPALPSFNVGGDGRVAAGDAALHAAAEAAGLPARLARVPDAEVLAVLLRVRGGSAGADAGILASSKTAQGELPALAAVLAQRPNGAGRGGGFPAGGRCMRRGRSRDAAAALATANGALADAARRVGEAGGERGQAAWELWLLPPRGNGDGSGAAASAGPTQRPGGGAKLAAWRDARRVAAAERLRSAEPSHAPPAPSAIHRPGARSDTGGARSDTGGARLWGPAPPPQLVARLRQMVVETLGPHGNSGRQLCRVVIAAALEEIAAARAMANAAAADGVAPAAAAAAGKAGGASSAAGGEGTTEQLPSDFPSPDSMDEGLAAYEDTPHGHGGCWQASFV
eukprot:365139-Chlamydomonas_euryale.AAC.33